MKHRCVLFASAILLAGCSTPKSVPDPFPGSGGLYLGTPSREDIQSGRSVFDVKKFSGFRIGATTKMEIAKALGRPAWWSTEPNGSSSMGYDFVRKESFLGMSKIERATFSFDAELKLSKAEYPLE